MQDGIIKGTGNSRYLKSVSNFLNLYPNYEAFAQALVNGTLPIDLNGINTDGWRQLGTLLDTNTLLAQSVATYLGLDATTSTPSQAFATFIQMAQDYALLDSPHFKGYPEAPTPTTTSSDDSIATTAFVKNVIGGVRIVTGTYTGNANPGTAEKRLIQIGDVPGAKYIGAVIVLGTASNFAFSIKSANKSVVSSLGSPPSIAANTGFTTTQNGFYVGIYDNPTGGNSNTAPAMSTNGNNAEYIYIAFVGV